MRLISILEEMHMSGDSNENGYIAVGEVIKNKYRIPKYQRGYRWSEEHIFKLLKDIYEDRLIDKRTINGFVNNTEANVQLSMKVFKDGKLKEPISPYCIQPLVVMEKKDTDYYDIIDGQQRLTSIAIIRAALKNIGKLSENECEAVILQYESRENSEKYLESLYKNEEISPQSNIDFDYMKQAYDVAQGFFSNALDEIEKDIVKKVYVSYLDNILCWSTMFIWYEVTGDDPQKVFANFNTGKIELTNAELIKALFMNPANYESLNIKDKQIVISEKWDEIESQLHDPDFWAFVPHRNQYDMNINAYSTRIDIIFEFSIMNNWLSKNTNKSISDYINYRKSKFTDKFIFNEIDSWIAESLLNREKKSKDEVMNKCWNEIRRVFANLRELYSTDGRGSQSSKIYNLVGLYINLRNRLNNSVDRYTDSNDEYLRIYHDLHQVLQKPRNERKAELTIKIKESLGFNYMGRPISKIVRDIRYNEGDSSEIVKVLLTYNIALLNSSGGIGERFNFFANAKNKWEREHIFARATDESKSNDIQQDRQSKRKAALNILSQDDYVAYVKYIYDNTDSNIEYTSSGVKRTMDENDDASIQEFINANLAYDGNGFQELLARALKAKKDSQLYLEYYTAVDEIERINNMQENCQAMLLEKYIDDHKDNFATKGWLDVSNYRNKIKDIFIGLKFKEGVNSQNLSIDIKQLEWTYTVPKDIFESIKNKDIYMWLSEPLDADSPKTNLDNLLDKMQEAYSTKIKDIISKEIKIHNEKNDGTNNSHLEDGSNYSLIMAALKLNKITLERAIDRFFENDFARLLRDNTMGNMALLTGGGQNQAVGNKPYSEKRKIVYECFKKGQFVPLGTIFVFTDLYTGGVSSADFWLPDSRMKYIQDIIDALEKLFGQTKEGY